MKYAMTTFMTVVMMTSMILFINVKISKSQDSGNGNDNSCMYKVDGMGVTYDISQLKMEGFDYKIYGGDLPCTPEKEDNYTYTFNFKFIRFTKSFIQQSFCIVIYTFS